MKQGRTRPRLLARARLSLGALVLLGALAGCSADAGVSSPTDTPADQPAASSAGEAITTPTSEPTPAPTAVPPAPTQAPPAPTQAPAAPTALPVGGGSGSGCYIDPEGNCYRAGEFCPASLYGQTVQGSSGPIKCENVNGYWRWENV